MSEREFTLGFVGLGRMGAPMACRLIGIANVRVFDLQPDAVKAIAAKGAEAASSICNLADTCDIVFLSLPSVAVVQDAGEVLARGSRCQVVVDLSTVGPQCSIDLSDLLQANGKALVEAPVSGGIAGAEKGALSLMVSGPADAIACASPYIERLGRIFDMGEQAGAGQTMKLVNNLLGACAIAITAEGVTLGMKAGLDPSRMVEVLNASTGRNSATEDKWPRSVLPRSFDFGFATGLCLKDVNLCVEVADESQVPLEVGRVVQNLLKRTSEQFGADSDFTCVAQTVEQGAAYDYDSLHNKE